MLSLRFQMKTYACNRGIINLLNFIFTSLHGYQITPGLSTGKQRQRLLLLKAGIYVASIHL